MIYDDISEEMRRLHDECCRSPPLIGADHPDTARSLNNLAGLYRVQGGMRGRADVEGSAIMERVLGAEHPNAIMRKNYEALLAEMKSRGGSWIQIVSTESYCLMSVWF